MSAKIWYQYPHDEGFGHFPDPIGRYPKPDANFYTIPQGTPITVPPGGSGTVTNVRSVNWDKNAGPTDVVTIQFDSPPNDVAKYYAFSFVKNATVRTGQHVSPGDTVAFSGNPQNIGVAYAFSSVPIYGESSRAEPFVGTFVDPKLSPIQYLRDIQTGAAKMPTINLQAFVDNIAAGISNGAFGQSPNTLNFLLAWAHQEGGAVTNQCKFNPLNTMQDETGAVQCQGAMPGIKSYPDNGTGLKGTVDALLSGHYPSLVNAISTSDENHLGFNSQNIMAANVAEDLSTWLSGKRQPIKSDYIFKIMAQAGISPQRIEGVSAVGRIGASSQADRDKWGQVDLGLDTSGQTVGGVQDQIANQLKSFSNFFSGLTSFFSDPIRVIKIIIGFILIVIGATLLVKEMIPPTLKRASKDIGFPLA